MKVGSQHVRTIVELTDRDSVKILDQTLLPHEISWVELATVEDAIEAINKMRVRGAPLIGVMAAYGLFFASKKSQSFRELLEWKEKLENTRPTAVNLRWALDRVIDRAKDSNGEELKEVILSEARKILQKKSRKVAAAVV